MVKETLLKSRLLPVILLLIMLFNLILLFVIDNYVVKEEVFRETGNVVIGEAIPTSLGYTSSYSIYTTELLIHGCCHITILDKLNNETRVLDSNGTITKKFVTLGINSYYIQNVNGSFNYTYIVLREHKPLIYLSIPATIVSLLGFLIAILVLSYHIVTSDSKPAGASKGTKGSSPIQSIAHYSFSTLLISNGFKHLLDNLVAWYQ